MLTPGMGAVSTTFMAGVELGAPWRSAACRLAHSTGEPFASASAPKAARRSIQRLRSARGPRRSRLRRLGHFSRHRATKPPSKSRRARRQASRQSQAVPQRHQAHEGRLRPELRQKSRRQARQKRQNEIRPGRADSTTTFANSKNPESARPHRDGLVRLRPKFSSSRTTSTKRSKFSSAAMKENHAAIAPSMLYAYAAIQERRSLRQRRAQSHRRTSRARRTGQGEKRSHLRQGFQDRPNPDENDSLRPASKRACSA